MLIALHDAEREHLKGKRFPNYALMKLSAYHKAQGDTVEWWEPLRNDLYGAVYSSKVFDFTPENPYLPPNTIRGGTGYDVKSKLPAAIDCCYPDYNIYPECDYAIGYITRGCPNKCRWCVVPEKEGGIRFYMPPRELVHPRFGKLVLMDNNILAIGSCISILRDLRDTGKGIDFNQGLDARLVTPEIADILAQLKWIKYIRFSCDTRAQISAIERTAALLSERGIKPSRLFIYLLVTQDIDDAEARLEVLRKLGGLTVYAQAERNERLGIRPNAQQLEYAQRYVYGGLWRKMNFTEYCDRQMRQGIIDGEW